MTLQEATLGLADKHGYDGVSYGHDTKSKIFVYVHARPRMANFRGLTEHAGFSVTVQYIGPVSPATCD